MSEEMLEEDQPLPDAVAKCMISFLDLSIVASRYFQEFRHENGDYSDQALLIELLIDSFNEVQI